VTFEDARSYADSALEAAERRGVRIGVCVVDHTGNIMQFDRMDGAPPMAAEVAEAKALTALNFQRSTAEVGASYGTSELQQLASAVRFPLLTAPGGVPVINGGTIEGAIGISGASGSEDDVVATDALAGVR
jgi:glc operon protein GlcG